MKITREQAEVLIQFMSQAARAAAEDEMEGTGWRVHRFETLGPDELFKDFNEGKPEEP
jgi:hypothetical protein